MTATNEQVFVNGKIFTARNEEEFVSAFKVTEGGKISWTGDASEVDGVGAIDLQGKTVLPGFIEGYAHPTYVAVTLGAVACVTPVVNDIPKMIEALKQHHTPDPEGGKFGRYDNGEPNGVLLDHGANDVVLNAKRVQDYPHEVGKIAATTEHFDERGIVAITDMMVFTKPYDHLKIYRDAEAEGLKQQAVIYYDWAALLKDPIGDLTDEQRSGRVKIGGIKLFMDGSVSNRTAWMKDAYPHSDEHGMTTLTDEAIQAGYEWASRNKVQMVFHATGDQGLGHIIDLLADKGPWMEGEMPSVRLEHATLLDEDRVRRINGAKMNFGVVSQIIFFFVEYDSYVQNLSESQFRRTYPVKTFYDDLEHVALSSDAPATTWAQPDNVFVSRSRRLWSARPTTVPTSSRRRRSPSLKL